MKIEEIERINLTHRFDFADIVNIITTEPLTPYGIYFSDQDVMSMLEPHNHSVIIKANIH